MTFHRPCHRSSNASIAYSIAHTNGYSIGCYRPCHRRCSIPPHLYGDGSAYRRLGDGSRFPRHEEGRGKDLIVDNIGITPRSHIGPVAYLQASSRAINGLTSLWSGLAALPSCFHSAADMVSQWCKRLILHALFCGLPILLDHREGVFARDVSTSQQLVERLGARETWLGNDEISNSSTRKDRGGRGVGGRIQTPAISDLSSQFRGGSQKTSSTFAALEDR